MYRKYSLLVLILLLFTSCIANKTDNFIVVNQKQKLEKSFLIWKKIKLDNNSIYSFNSEFTSWTGFGNRSTIFVDNEKIVKKEFISWNSKSEIIERFTEYKNNIGNSNKGITPHTIDELYGICIDYIIKKDKHTNKIYIGYDENNILNYCLYSPKNCADDCSEGVEINNIKF